MSEPNQSPASGAVGGEKLDPASMGWRSRWPAWLRWLESIPWRAVILALCMCGMIAVVAWGSLANADVPGVLKLLDVLAWPVIGLTAMLLFREAIRQFLTRVIRARAGGIELEAASHSELAKVKEPNVTLDLTRSYSLYWVGIDLLQAAYNARILVDPKGKDILFNLRQARHHLQVLELTDAAPVAALGQLIVEASTVEEVFSVDLRRRINQTCVDIVFRLDAYLKELDKRAEPRPQGAT